MKRVCVRERETQGSLAWVRHIAGKVNESDSVGTSGRKGRENTVAFGMGTLGLRRLGVGSEVLL